MKRFIINLLNRIFPHKEPRQPLFFDTTNESWLESINRRKELTEYLHH